MGARLVAAAFVLWPHLPHAQFRMLTGMALRALDPPGKDGRPPMLYFDGEDGLVDLLGRSRSQAYDVLAALRKAGAVSVVEAGRSRHRAVYKLALDVFQGPEHPDAIGSGTPGREGSGTPGHTGSGTPGPLGATLGFTGKSLGGQTSPKPVPHQAPDEPVDNDPEYTAARAQIELLDPERYGDAMQRIYADDPTLTNRDVIVRVAQSLAGTTR